ncbi:hypothetical protein CTI12_AA486210 [Artemisia annua]|uniref:Uncharacterized protein n=1 Tax=Artemisia annua TaxID=35608 RepID=A0A2U1LJ69_ARTAN|nr:hypothetical protein CTI12_AA486210 [Artemisia annua]
MAASKPPSFQQAPPSYVDDYYRNQAPYVKPPSVSDFVPTRPVSTKEDQQRQQLAEKSAPALEEVRPGQDSYQEGDGTLGVGASQDGAKTPSFQDVAPGKGKSEYGEGQEDRKEKLPSQSDIRTPNQNDSSGHQEHRIRINKPPSSYNGKNFEKYRW